MFVVQSRLQNTVIDLEVANQTASPTVDPSVHVFLLGHSMGGIVAAETLLLVASEQPIPSGTSSSLPTGETEAESPILEPGTFMFPHVQGVLAFDTPFLGIAPGVVSYGAEGHYRNATTAYNTFSEVAGLFGYGKNASGSANSTSQQEAPKPLPPSADAAAAPSWQRWGRYAMFAGAAGAVAAGGAAALYSQRQNLTAGFTWVSSHLEFVGCLARPSELKRRLEGLVRVQEDRGIRSVNFFTCLGKGAGNLVAETQTGKTSFSQKIIRSKNRTFCLLPEEVEHGEGSTPDGLKWTKAVNDQASDEVQAHVSMFLPKDNPAFLDLLREASMNLVSSIDRGWYDSSSGPADVEDPPQPAGPVDDFVADDDVVVVKGQR